MPHLRSKNWDTRIAASLALESILKSSGTWKASHSDLDPPVTLTSNLRMLSVKDLSQNDNKLLASTGQEYASLNGADLQSAKSEAARRLGLGFLEPDDGFGFDVEHELTSSHHKSQPVPPPQIVEDVKPQAPPPTQEAAMDEGNTSGMSARERNRLKRKRKLGHPINPAPSKIRVQEPTIAAKVEPDEDVKPSQEALIVDPKAKAEERAAEEKAAQSATQFIERPAGEYPFSALADVLQLDLLNSSWEVRHGAAVGLRELFKAQGAGGGTLVNVKEEDNACSHAIWLENMAANVLCVLVLDRFGDFISDQVICPVRETASQTLASLVIHMSEASTRQVHSTLHAMVYQSYLSSDGISPASKGDKGFVWEIRHAGLLGLKYFVAVKRSFLGDDNDILKMVVDSTILGLNDLDDDVRAVAASTLQPIVDVVITKLPTSVPQILDAIWDSFSQLKDDLCSSTGIVMSLLSDFVAYESTMKELLDPHSRSRPSLPELISRLYPFFRHTLASVRLAVVNTLNGFLKVSSLPKDWINETLLRFVYQNMILEERSDIRAASLELFHSAINLLKPQEVQRYVFEHLQGWFAIVMTPIGLPMDSTFFLRSQGVHNQNVNAAGHNVDKNIMAQDLSLVSVENILRGRYAGVNAIAKVLSKWPIESQELSFCGLIPAYVTSSFAIHQQLAAALVEDWAYYVSGTLVENPLAKSLQTTLISLLMGDTPSTYAEMGILLTQIRNECQIVYSSLINDGKLKKDVLPSIPVEVDPTGSVEGAFSLSVADKLMGSDYDAAVNQINNRKKNAVSMIDDRQRKAVTTIQLYKTRKERFDTQVYSAIAAAIIALGELPQKLNPLIRSTMNSIKVSTLSLVI